MMSMLRWEEMQWKEVVLEVTLEETRVNLNELYQASTRTERCNDS